MSRRRIVSFAVFLSLALLLSTAALAQQTGSISGRVTTDAQPLPGVTVEARSNVLPQPRLGSTLGNGNYNLPALPPGSYTVTFTLAGMRTVTRNVQVLLEQAATVNVEMSVESVSETITITAESPLIDPTSTAIKSAVERETIQAVPTGQDYRDLMKLAPAIQYTEDSIRGPSSGGSGQDNVYQFDGVNITLPLYGTLSAEPSSHDIAQVAITKGGAKAVDFNRAAGFTMDSVSKSGTNEWSGELKYQIQNADFTADQDYAVTSIYDQDAAWLTAGLGGPILRDRLYFYGSYYNPTVERANSSNAYGVVPNYESDRDELFGKLTITPIGNLLIHGSYRDSSTTTDNDILGAFEHPSVGSHSESGQTIAILEGSWVINPRSFATFKYNDYELLTGPVADTMVGAVPSLSLGTQLNVGNLSDVGYFNVPSIRSNSSAEYIAFVQPILDKYGYLNSSGVRTGGGAIGGASYATNKNDFFRESMQAAYDFTLGESLTHDIHVGAQQYEDSELLQRASNGWGSVSVPHNFANCPAGTDCAGQRYYYIASFLRVVGGTGAEPALRSYYESTNLEVNDTIRLGNWALNVGFITGKDTLFGQGLKNDSSAESGYVLSPGTKYEMYEVDFGDQIQPRLGATWAYNGVDTVYASYAKYNPAVSSLPRAASWDRSLFNQLYEVYFDQNGVEIGNRAVGGSSGKLFVKDLDPRYTDEFVLGTSRQMSNAWTARAYARYRYSTNFWEDTNNNARVDFGAPDDIPHELYIPELNSMRTQICASNRTICPSGMSGSSYVIAELEGAFTKYWEATLESDVKLGRASFNGTYTWSHYYGTFDQDNTTIVNDASLFVGSSNVGDDPGRQMWDFRYGDLRADRRHLLKVYGYYSLPWRATIGAYSVYQSGHAWEMWNYEPYKHLTTSTNESNRYGEPAGSRRTDDHYQVDLNYTQNIPFRGLNLQLIGDIYNVTDNQTGYNPEPRFHNSNFGNTRSYYRPQRFQLAMRLQF